MSLRPSYRHRGELSSRSFNPAPNLDLKNQCFPRIDYGSTLRPNTSSRPVPRRSNNWPSKRNYADPSYLQRLKNAHYDPSIEHARKSAPSVLDTAPAEFREFLQQLPIQQKLYFAERQPYVPPGYVHLRLFYDSKNLPDRFWAPTKEAILPLESDGGLDLTPLKKLWNQNTCIPISPTRFKPVKRADPDRLSPMTVMMLREFFGCITFISCRVPLKEPTFNEKVKETLHSVVQAGNQQLVKTFNHPISLYAQDTVGYYSLQLQWRLQAAFRSNATGLFLAFVALSLPFALMALRV